jgi:uncharacterized protein (DUF488 family)
MSSDVIDRTAAASRLEISDLTSAVFGRSLSLADALDLVESGPPGFRASREIETNATVWVGSIGYESFKTNDEFAETLVHAGVELLLDVRDLPISRKRGFAKTALSEAVMARGIEYRHMKELGNPKEFRDLYKSGQVKRGRAGYERLLRDDRSEHVLELSSTLQAKRSALMCVEQNEDVCHRQSIFEAITAQTGFDLEIAQLS